MRILDEKADKKLDLVTLYLTTEEAKQLQSDIAQLLRNPKHHHTHMSSDDYKKEITVCLYDENKLDSFDQRSKKLIKEDL